MNKDLIYLYIIATNSG